MPAYLFSGQGAQKAGMGTELAMRYDAAAKIYQQASEQVSVNLLELDETQLSQTLYAQLAIVTLSYAAFETWQSLLREENCMLAQGCFAGFSLGEYTALAAAGVLDFHDLLDLISYRAQVMQAASEEQPGIMIAVIGLDKDTLLSTLNEDAWQSRVWLANNNAPGQIVIAGYADETAACAETLKEKGARRLVKLNVSGAFHTPLMQTAADQLKTYANSLTFNKPLMPVYSNTSAGILPDDMNWPHYLSVHMCSSVRWVDTLQAAAAGGQSTFIEFGPGKVLTGLVKKTLRESVVFNVETPDDLKKLTRDATL